MSEGPEDRGALLRELPSVESLLRSPEARVLEGEVGPAFLADCARCLVEGWRSELRAGGLGAAELVSRRRQGGALLGRLVRERLRPSLVPVVNATGVVVHTNLGRAPWPARVAARALEVATRYTNLEYDVARGRRGKREAHLASARRLFGAQAALVVNNNAAALFLVLDTLASGRETLVSRGELVEIGDSFRIPDILAKSGSLLREVGTTNRTRLSDYERAITDRSALLLKVHPSNFRIQGFQESTSIRDLAGLARRTGLALVEDLGSGAVEDLAPRGVPGEPWVGESLAAGADLVTISGDKLLGGPQAGIVLGREDLVDRLRTNPLYRALRPDKVTIAALEELLAIYLARDPWREVPVLASLACDPAALRERAGRLAAGLRERGLEAAVVEGDSAVGGGAAPAVRLPAPLVAAGVPGLSAAKLEAALRRHTPPVIARVEADRLLLDLRTVFEDEDGIVLEALGAAAVGQ